MRIRDFFARGLSIDDERPVFQSEKLTFSYGDADRSSRQIAAGLSRSGAGELTGIALLTPNDVRGLVCMLAIHQLGAHYVRLNYRSELAENLHILRQSGADWLFFHSDGRDMVEQIAREVPTVRHFVCIDRTVDGHLSIEDLIQGAGFDLPVLVDDRNHLAMLASTGGTTGLPKLVMLTDGIFETVVAAQLANLPYSGTPKLLISSAMTHAAASLMHAVMAQGGTILLHETFDPGEVLQAITRDRVTHIYLPPTAIYMLLDHPRARGIDYGSLAYLVYGAAPMAPHRLREAMETFGPVMAQFYGQAECPMFISTMSPVEHIVALNTGNSHLLASAGRPSQFCRVTILDDDDQPLPPGTIGEIAVSGNLVMSGYRSADGDKLFPAGKWHRTGDLGRLDDGFLYIVDRARDLIISGGFNVYPGEVEKLLHDHPAVAECAVIGTPHDKWGEEVRAVVRLRDGHSVDADELITFAKQNLGSIKAPKVIEFRAALPKSAAGKILKRDLREEFWAGRDRRV
jgi:acyl-CoA synthetase (AMP-forming)/AMP-acid ligase II